VTATDPNGGQIRSPTWTFTTTPGKPIATIVDVSPTPGQEGSPVSFDGSASDPGGSVVAYEWSSDLDGILSEEEDFSTSDLSPGTHTISFRARDDDDLWSDLVTYELFVEDTSPIAAITEVSPAPGHHGSPVAFDGTASDDGGSIVTYEWVSDIDGLLAEQEDFSTSLLSPGTHTISFRVLDNDDLWSDLVTYQLVVEESKPTATIVEVSPTPGQQGSLVTFEGSTVDLGGNVVAYEWKSDVDGLLSEEEDFSTLSLSPGAHLISFRVRDNADLWSDVVTYELFVEELDDPTLFRRGAPNRDTNSDLSDGIYVLSFLFSDGETPLCTDAADTDDSGEVDISDAINLFAFLFLGGIIPPPPGHHDRGPDPTESPLSCEEYGVCE
jgi:uncharacterized Zn-binding protein involved in type VI secretion